MGYDHYFSFIKDDLIDPNIAFMQNVDNFLFCNYFGYLDRYDSDIKEKRNEALSNLFHVIKELLMNKHNGIHGGLYVQELINLKYNNRKFNYAELQVDLMLYCILVNGLNKTKGKRFERIRKRVQPLTKILKEMFCEFDKNKIHEERTFIFVLRSPAGTHDEYYIINYKDDLLNKSSDNNYDFYDDVKDDSDEDDSDKEIRTILLFSNNVKTIAELEEDGSIEEDGCIEDYYFHAGKEKIKISLKK